LQQIVLFYRIAVLFDPAFGRHRHGGGDQDKREALLRYRS
jgi:hypothetical protein